MEELPMEELLCHKSQDTLVSRCYRCDRRPPTRWVFARFPVSRSLRESWNLASTRQSSRYNSKWRTGKLSPGSAHTQIDSITASTHSLLHAKMFPSIFIHFRLTQSSLSLLFFRTLTVCHLTYFSNHLNGHHRLYTFLLYHLQS